MKRSFDIDIALKRIEKAVQPFPKAAMFELAEQGFGSVFEQLVACMISIRTYDEVSLPTAKRLLEHARTPKEINKMTPKEIDSFINTSMFHERKAEQIHVIAQRVMEDYDGDLPCDRDVLLSFPGVGPKCANLVLGVACKQPFISVDIHVHRVTNRWGYIKATTPEKSLLALEGKLPQKQWININRLLVPFGKHICMGNLPKCSTCPVLEMCQQVGVKEHR
jgi:endonuclease-3